MLNAKVTTPLGVLIATPEPGAHNQWRVRCPGEREPSRSLSGGLDSVMKELRALACREFDGVLSSEAFDESYDDGRVRNISKF